ncbi:cytidylate kinase family protein [Maridesulfovibrio zosterae]|uniref:cytidylate kinase family protein n=1 Tax=Maridesulfovibrio zosterae TaxID=82171 RepID=UPI0004233E67|nr:cytidylate kinase family protein [Maridesulfovibrio zosterae]
MKIMNMTKRTVTFVLGVFIMAIGVTLSVKANLGVSAISCIPYIYSLKYNFTIGEFTIFMNIICILLQIILLRKKYSPVQLSQLVAITAFGYCIDFSMYLLSGIDASSYLLQVAWCLLGCVALAFGVFLLVKANLTYLPVDGLSVAISDVFKKEFGKVKVGVDCSLASLGIVSSFLLLHKLEGIREGTIAAALFVGMMVKFFNAKLPIVDRWLGNKTLEEEIEDDINDIENSFFVITIAREYGSGGHGIGKKIAGKLGISFYDDQLVDITAEKSGFTKEYIAQNEQKIANTLLDELYVQNYAYVNDHLPPSDILFLRQSKIIREICSKESCVIVGRCGNFILKDNPKCFNVFIHANMDYRLSKIVDEYGVEAEISTKELKRSDNERSNYCLKYTGKDWADSRNYHIAIDSSLDDDEGIAQKVVNILQGTNLASF